MADAHESKRSKGRPPLLLSEKKRRKAVRETERSISRVHLGDQFVQWRSLMEELGMSSDTEMAKFLLDSYEVTKNVGKDVPKHAEPMASTSTCFASTPGPVILEYAAREKTPSVSEVSAVESGRYHRYYNKKSNRWSVRELIQKALISGLGDKRGMKQRRELKENDPRRISKNLAPEEPPSTDVLVKEKISRF